MAASLMNILDDLETRLERTQAELHALREENQRLKQQLALERTQKQSVPNQETTTTAEIHGESEEAPEKEAPKKEAPVAIGQSPQTGESVQPPSPHALLNQWYERYPKAFFKGHTKPLKVGIHQDLAEREEWSHKLIRRALANYVNLPRYIKAVRIGAERVDLDGQPAGKVDKEAALHASEKRGDKKESGQPKKAQSKQKPAATKPRQVAVEQAENEKSEPRKPLSMEDKLLGLQQKFKGG